MQPKKKTSKARTGLRRAHQALAAPQYTHCPNCGQPRRPHSACSRCGYVNPQLKLTVEEES